MSSNNIEMINLEFFVNNSDATMHNEYVVKNGRYYAIDCLEQNQIDILFLKFANHQDLRNYTIQVFKETQSRIVTVKKVVHKFFGELDGKKMDIDATGVLNIEKVGQEKKANNFYRNTMDIADIDEGALWELRGDCLVLVDEDQHRSLRFGEWGGFFEKG